MLEFEVVKRMELVPGRLDIALTDRIRDVGSPSATDAVNRFRAMFRQREDVPRIKVLAERQREGGAPATHSLIVIDGGLRVLAARLEGIEKIAVDVVVPQIADASPDEMFLACNLRHGLPLLNEQRDRVIRTLALQYKKAHKDLPRMELRAKFTYRLSKRIGLAPSTIQSIVVGIFGHRTPEERAEDDRLLAAGMKPREIAKRRGVSRQTVEKTDPARRRKRQTARRQLQQSAEVVAAAHNGDVPPAVLSKGEEQMTLRDLDSAMSKICEGLHTVCNQIAMWILPNVTRYSPDTLQALWGRVDPFAGVLLRLGVAARAYADPKVAERDLEWLGKAFDQALLALGLHNPALPYQVSSNGNGEVKVKIEA